MDLNIGQRIGDGEEQQRRAMENTLANARMSMPGEIIDFDEIKQTATVQPLIQENVKNKWTTLPQLLDVPVFFPRAGGHCLTFPVKPGDECLVVFSDMCLDAWWQSGGVQIQQEMRRHDLSDAMALLGITCVPRAVKEYSTDSVKLRNEENDAFFEIKDDKTINIKSVEDINIETEKNINVKTALDINITSAQRVDVSAVSDILIRTNANLTINSTGNTEINSDADLKIKSAGNLTLESDGEIELKAPKINLN